MILTTSIQELPMVVNASLQIAFLALIRKAKDHLLRRLRILKLFFLRNKSGSSIVQNEFVNVPIGPRRLESKIEPAFGSIYLTLLSVIQSVALGFLAAEVNQQLFGYHSRSATSLVLIVTTFFTYVLVWHSYLNGLLAVYWKPTIVDSLLPFAIGMCECLLVPSTVNPPAWFILASALTVFGALVNMNSLLQTRDAPYESINSKMAAKRRSIASLLSRLAMGIVFLLLAVICYLKPSFSFLAALATIFVVSAIMWESRKPIDWPVNKLDA